MMVPGNSVAVALSGGRDSAALLYLAVTQGRNPIAIHATMPYMTRLATLNAVRLARRLNVPLVVVPVDLDNLQAEYRTGFAEMRNGKSPWRSVCLRCAGVLHGAINEMAVRLGADEVWYGMTRTQVDFMVIPSPEYSGIAVRWPFCEDPRLESSARLLLCAKFGRMGPRWWPPLTNCKVNWAIMQDELAHGRENPYEGYFLRHTKTGWGRLAWRVAFKAVNIPLRFGLARPGRWLFGENDT